MKPEGEPEGQVRELGARHGRDQRLNEMIIIVMVVVVVVVVAAAAA